MVVAVSVLRHDASSVVVVGLQGDPGHHLGHLPVLLVLFGARWRPGAVLTGETEGRQAAVAAAPVLGPDAVGEGALVQVTLAPVNPGAKARVVVRAVGAPGLWLFLGRAQIGVRRSHPPGLDAERRTLGRHHVLGVVVSPAVAGRSVATVRQVELGGWHGRVHRHYRCGRRYRPDGSPRWSRVVELAGQGCRRYQQHRGRSGQGPGHRAATTGWRRQLPADRVPQGVVSMPVRVDGVRGWLGHVVVLVLGVVVVSIAHGRLAVLHLLQGLFLLLAGGRVRRLLGRHQGLLHGRGRRRRWRGDKLTGP